MSDVARRFVMEFERPLDELEGKLASLKHLDVSEQPDLAAGRSPSSRPRSPVCTRPSTPS